MKTLSEILKDFDKKFIANKQEDEEYYRFWLRDDKIKEFLSSSLKQLLEQVVPEERELPKTKCMNLENHTFGSCFQCEKDKGYNVCRKETLDNIKDLIKE